MLFWIWQWPVEMTLKVQCEWFWSVVWKLVHLFFFCHFLSEFVFSFRLNFQYECVVEKFQSHHKYVYLKLRVLLVNIYYCQLMYICVNQEWISRFLESNPRTKTNTRNQILRHLRIFRKKVTLSHQKIYLFLLL